jgi:hypothetical protein
MRGTEIAKYVIYTYILQLKIPSSCNMTQRYEVIGSQHFSAWNMKPVRLFEMPCTNYPVTYLHMLRQWFPGDPTVHFCNVCFEVYLPYKLKE